MIQRISSPKTVEIELSDLIDLALVSLAYDNLEVLDAILDIMPKFGQEDFTNFFMERGIVEMTRNKLEDDLDIVKENAMTSGKWIYSVN